MAKSNTQFVCSECGYTSPKWLGRCPDCGKFNSLIEETIAPPPVAKKSGGYKNAVQSRAVPLSQVAYEKYERTPSGISELDVVLGGGIVRGSLVLVGGDPGVGKSTLLTQVAAHLAKEHKVLYLSAEESCSQVKLRCERLGLNSDNLLLLNETNIDSAEEAFEGAEYVIVDSIQAVYTDALTSAAGSVGQVRECASRLMRIAKSKNITFFIVGHVTKEGTLAGPKVLEHIMDTVLYFEGERTENFKILRAVKNRYGSTNEIGVFEMEDKGLFEVENPSMMLLSGRPKNISGICVACIMEGSRPILAEVQSLVTPTGFGTPRRMATGVDYGRMSMLLAVLEKRAGYFVGNMDCYVNIIGGLKIDEPACDLSVALAIVSGLKDVPVPEDVLAFGEIGLKNSGSREAWI